MDRMSLASEQLRRMRGMTRYYHERFFADIRNTTLLVVGLLLIGWAGIEEAFLLIPVVALLGANQTAFDASYLHFARHYAARLESHLNEALGKKILVGAELEDSYLYPLNRRKLVTAHLGPGFSWFGWMTLLYTLTGALAFGVGIALGWPVLVAAHTGWLIFYVAAVGVMAIASLAIGAWWFVSGTGERRLREVLESEFGQTITNSNNGTST